MSQSEKSKEKERLKRQLICICKGVNLGTILPALANSDTVFEVNKKANVGNGGCNGERCGPKIKALIKKYKEAKKKKNE